MYDCSYEGSMPPDLKVEEKCSLSIIAKMSLTLKVYSEKKSSKIWRALM